MDWKNMRKFLDVLKEERLKKGIRLHELEQTTKIPRKYFQALDDGAYGILPTGFIYQRNIIRRYAAGVGMSQERLREIEQCMGTESENRGQEHGQLKPRVQQWHLMNAPRLLARAAVGVLASVAFIYIAVEVRNVIRPPFLQVYTPQDGIVESNGTIVVEGKTEKEARVSINNESVFSNEQGTFRTEVSIQPGLNVMRIIAVKKHGSKTEVTRQIIVK